MYQRKPQIAAVIAASNTPQRRRIEARLRFFSGSPVAGIPASVRSAPQYGQISVAWLTSRSHSRQENMVGVGPAPAGNGHPMRRPEERSNQGSGSLREPAG